MALTKPILYEIEAFDASYDSTILFNVIGGSQVAANSLYIKNNLTGELVYENKVSDFRFQHIIPANTLTNGTYYECSIETFDYLGEASPVSLPVQFYCYTKPTITTYNMPLTNVIENSVFNFQFAYNQIEGEILNNYQIILYNVDDSVISNSGIKYPLSETTTNLIISHEFNGFNDLTSYKVKAIGETVNNTKVESDLILFSVRYNKPNVFAIIELDNNCQDGYITIKSNITPVDGESNPSPPIYIDNKIVDVTGDGHYVLWQSGYLINGDFNLRVWGYNFNKDKNIVQLKNTSVGTIELYFKGTYVDVYIMNNKYSCYLFSNDFKEPENNEQLFINLTRKNNMYNLIAENRGVV